MARSVADCALFAGAAASGRDLGDPDVQPGRSRRASASAARRPGTQALPETQALLPRVRRALARAGGRVVERELPPEVAALEHGAPGGDERRKRARDGLGAGATPASRSATVLRERLELGLSR